MSNKSGGSSEGLIIAWALIIMAVCFLGGTATGTGPMEFFVIGFSAVFITLLIGGLLLGISVAIVQTFAASRRDHDRSFLEILKDRETWSMIKESFIFLIVQVKKDLWDEWKAGPVEVIEGKVIAAYRRTKSYMAGSTDFPNDKDDRG